MATIDSTLLKTLNIVKPTIPIPIIVTFNRKIEEADLDSLSRGGLNITSGGVLVPRVSGNIQAMNVKTLARLPFIATVFLDETRVIQIKQADRMSGGNYYNLMDSQKVLQVDKLKEIGLDGSGIKIAILDTGLDTDHPNFSGMQVRTISMVEGETISDGAGHGTWCASAIAGQPTSSPLGFTEGIAPKSELIIIKVLANNGSGQLSWILDGLEVAFEQGADIISMSLGQIQGFGGLGLDAQMVNEITKRGKLCIIAAGNSYNIFQIGSPGTAYYAITVGSVAINDPFPNAVSSFSSKGPTEVFQIKPDICSPGGNQTPDEYISAACSGWLDEDSDGWEGLRGTSMATPQIAACLALLMQEYGEEMTRENIEKLFIYNTTKRLRRKSIFNGWGTFQAYDAYETFRPSIEKRSLRNFLTRTIEFPFRLLASPILGILPKRESMIQILPIR